MSIKATQPEDSAVKKMTPGDDLHLTLLGVPMGWNFLIGQDRAEMLAYGRAVWNAALATPSPQPAEAKTAAVDGMTDEPVVWFDPKAPHGYDDSEAYASNASIIRHRNEGRRWVDRFTVPLYTRPASGDAKDAERYKYLRSLISSIEWNRLGHYAAEALDKQVDTAIATQGKLHIP